jgi:hypothetical protein
MLRTMGADLVGMSTVMETIAARHLGAEVLAISLVTNLAAGLTGEPLSHAEVIEAGRASASRMGALRPASSLAWSADSDLIKESLKGGDDGPRGGPPGGGNVSDVHFETPDSGAASFRFGEVSSLAPAEAATSPDPPLGPLEAFTGTFRGKGFNTIFRPHDAGLPTNLPEPAEATNVLELNLTEETLSFSPPLGSVPNRAESGPDIFLNGVPYLQVVTDVTFPVRNPRIHVEPGLWMTVPPASHPAGPGSLVRMASIPHGTTIVAQGGASPVTGPLTIPAIDITPFDSTGETIRQGSQFTDRDSNGSARIPQDLTPFVAAGTITQPMLCDPATFIRNHSQNQTMTSITEIKVSTEPASPLFGGGVSNIAFLLGDATASTPNGQVLMMESTFWIQTVEYSVQVPVFQPGQPPLTIAAEAGAAGQPVPRFLIDPPVAVTAPRTITATATQIQYAQRVLLHFDDDLTWPHVSVATLVPDSAVPVPAFAYESWV